MANSAKDGGRASANRRTAEMTDQTRAQIPGSSTMLIQAMVPVRACDPTTKIKNPLCRTSVHLSDGTDAWVNERTQT
ncbi:hypothetical protein Tdes44962_MAKER09520 [Teratosphaeria destructans]|uniref:Uncharacterized protein n=1 Tax=Teratosphaeria destructans TaxID=418781 RepID=A0A9W7W2S3_9PEZI|nr:hypothetical protein Tdes44962_MAKER09520 [Teratosphaeria destructans]